MLSEVGMTYEVTKLVFREGVTRIHAERRALLGDAFCGGRGRRTINSTSAYLGGPENSWASGNPAAYIGLSRKTDVESVANRSAFAYDYVTGDLRRQLMTEKVCRCD